MILQSGVFAHHRCETVHRSTVIFIEACAVCDEISLLKVLAVTSVLLSALLVGSFFYVNVMLSKQCCRVLPVLSF